VAIRSPSTDLRVLYFDLDDHLDCPVLAAEQHDIVLEVLDYIQNSRSRALAVAVLVSTAFPGRCFPVVTLEIEPREIIVPSHVAPRDCPIERVYRQRSVIYGAPPIRRANQVWLWLESKAWPVKRGVLKLFN